MRRSNVHCFGKVPKEKGRLQKLRILSSKLQARSQQVLATALQAFLFDSLNCREKSGRRLCYISLMLMRQSDWLVFKE